MGNAESIVIVPDTEIELKTEIPAQTRDIFGDVADDILGPVEGLLSDAFNAFKVPLGDIVHFVVSNVLGSLIKFIMHAVEEIFPGIPGTEELAKSIISQYVQLIVAASVSIENAVLAAISTAEKLGSNITIDLGSMISEITGAFDEMKHLSQVIVSKSKTIVGEVASAFDVGGNDLTLIVSEGRTSLHNLILGAIERIAKLTENLAENLESVINGCYNSVFAKFKSLVDDIRACVSSMTGAFDSVGTKLIVTIQQQIDLAKNAVITQVKAEVSEAKQLIALVSAEVTDVPVRAKTVIASAMSRARAVEADLTKYTAATEQAAITDTVDLVKKVTADLGSATAAIGNLGQIFAVAVVAALILIIILVIADIRRVSKKYSS